MPYGQRRKTPVCSGPVAAMPRTVPPARGVLPQEMDSSANLLGLTRNLIRSVLRTATKAISVFLE
jgi:hypothetical protein